MKKMKNNVTDLHNNISLSTIFHQMADCYRYLSEEEYFRAVAYENVVRKLKLMKEDISQYATSLQLLDSLPGIGESIAGKIMEYLRTGKIRAFTELKKRVPFELLDLMELNGFGPATLKTLHTLGGINNRKDLINTLQTGKLTKLKGFGEKRIDSIKRALKLNVPNKRLLLKDAEKTGNEILCAIKNIPGVQKAELAGSLRRKKETIGDIDIVVQAEPKNRNKIVTGFIHLPQVARVLAKGAAKASVLLSYENIQVDIRLVNDFEYGAAMLYFTGSKEHTIKLRMMAKERGYKINEYGIFDTITHKKLAGATEEEMYHFLGLAFIPPELRVNNGEMEKAIIRKPRLSAMAI